jgi:hypothetical protein
MQPVRKTSLQPRLPWQYCRITRRQGHVIIGQPIGHIALKENISGQVKFIILEVTHGKACCPLGVFGSKMLPQPKKGNQTGFFGFVVERCLPNWLQRFF